MRPAIIEALRTGRNTRDLPVVLDALRAFEPSELFETLFPLSVREQGERDPVAFSAYALNALNPPCPLSLSQAVESLLPHWDISIEEVVFYLARQFGAKAVAATARLMHNAANSDLVVARLRAIQYWASIYETKDQRADRGAT